MDRETKAAYDSLRDRDRAKLDNWFDRFCQCGGFNLPKTKFRHEGQFSTGGKDGRKIGIYAFKAVRQFRIYGPVVGVTDAANESRIERGSRPASETARRVASRESFLGLTADAAKKQDAANQQLLRRAAEKAKDFLI